MGADMHEGENVEQIISELITIWSKILAAESVRPEDDFFALGGDSLAATELMVAIQTRFSLNVDAVEIFERPVLKDFAELLNLFHRNPEGGVGDVAAD